MYCRGEHYRAAMQACQNLPAFRRELEWVGVYTTNIRNLVVDCSIADHLSGRAIQFGPFDGNPADN